MQLTQKVVFILLSSLILYFLFAITNLNSQNNTLTIGKALGIGGTGPEFTPTPTPEPTATPSPTPTPDIVNPTVAITNPQNGATIKKNNTVTIAATASDNVAVDRVEFYVNNVLTCTDATSPYTCAWFVPNKPRVTYTLVATAFDTSGNTASHAINVTSK